MPINTERLLERFLRYVKVPTTADPSSADYPSSSGQIELGKLLADELRHMGARDVAQDRHGLVWATIPASVKGDIPTILFNAHMDTSPDASGEDIAPQVIQSYRGGDIPLRKNQRVITVADCPALADLTGHCLVTTDGSTLLGGDDKAGVAAIMELAQHLLEHTSLPHGEVRVLFTCDEEIGRGGQYMDLERASAAAAYTLDGSGQGEIEAKNFSADSLTVRVTGNNIHPSIGKGRMVNAVRGLALLLADLPIDCLSPETTAGEQGFVHPYRISGDVSSAQVQFLLRDFDSLKLDEYTQLVEAAAMRAKEQLPGLAFDFERTRQYRNMAESLRRFPHVVELAVAAHEKLGQQARLGAIRGGTDGALFSEMGLPTPNLSVGQHNIHSELEFVSLNEMSFAVEHAIALLDQWQAHARS